MSDQNKDAARRWFDAWNTGELDLLDEIVAPDAVDHDRYNPNASGGLEGAKRTVAMYREAFPDIAFTVDDVIAEGDKVVVRWTATGTHQGEIMGIPATGNKSTVSGIGIDRFEDGKIVEAWNAWDTLGMMQNIGALPQQEAASA
ncbi:MAG TPA: ester cyclase [Thermoleophilaceae bacterium]|nr:ester cyclase [Thermoleophilaceae bacterium]